MAGTKRRIGIALGSGGAKGLAHIPMLEVFDELGIRPSIIAGCSMGAVVGVSYADGIRAHEIRERVEAASIRSTDKLSDALFKRDVLDWFELLSFPANTSGLLGVDGFIDSLTAGLSAASFAELKIPLLIVASDFWRREPVLLQDGPLIEAVHASMAMPGIFSPVRVDGQVLVDGGAVNPVPYDLLFEHCDVVIAVDVMGQREFEEGELPSLPDAVFNTFQIMQRSILREKIKARPPDILVQPEITGIRVLEFYRGAEVFSQAQAGKDQLKAELTAILE